MQKGILTTIYTTIHVSQVRNFIKNHELHEICRKTHECSQ